ESFPQLDIASLMTAAQLEAAAASRGGTFPRPQHLSHFTAVLPPPPPPSPPPASGGSASAAGAAAASGGGGSAGGGGPAAAACGVALLGDAVHCFPPDLGQGVNSALLDVVALMQALDEAGGDLRVALPLFEQRRAPEARALAELMTFSYPYQ
ncbi:Kynurenine 3-monooxygenase, partial [Tetrabaena socialis]